MKDILIGTWAWGTGYNGGSLVFGKKQDPEILKQTFDEAVKHGFLNWDTAAVYGMGSCEKLLGTFIKGREDIFISTKFFPPKKYKNGALTKSFNESRASCRVTTTRSITSPMVRAAAAEAAAQIHAKNCEEYVKKLAFQDDDPYVKSVARKAFDKLRDSVLLSA